MPHQRADLRFTNDTWDLTQPAWGDKNADSACIRVLGPPTTCACQLPL